LFYEDILTICCDDPDSPRVVVSLEGWGIAPEMELENEHNFGNIRIGDSCDWNLKIKNNGDDTLKIENIYVLEYKNAYTIEYDSRQILPDSTLFITITFQPHTSGEYPDTLIIKSNKFRGNNIVLLNGRGIQPEIECEPDSINFGIVALKYCKTLILSISNTGDYELSIDSIKIDPNSEVFNADKIAFRIPVGDTEKVKITFCPTNSDTSNAIATIYSDAVTNPEWKIDLSGIGSGDDVPPEIIHIPLGSIPKCSETVISATIQDTVSGVARASLRFRMGGEPEFYELEMSGTNSDKYEAKIPSNCVTTRGVEYYLFAEDSLGNHCRVPANSYYSIQVLVEGRGEVKTDSSWIYQTLYSGDTKNSYRLFSIPMELDHPNVDSLLRKNLGLKLFNWRVFDYDSDDFTECPDTSRFRPGKSYWLIVKKRGQVIFTGPGQSVKTSKEEPFEIPIDTSWTTFANPYNFNIPAEKLSVDGDVSKLNICTYQGRWVCGNEIEYLEPWEGYLIKHHQAATLSIPSDLTGYEKTPSNAQPNGWSIQIVAKCLNSIDSYNYIGVRDEASDGWDQFDLYEPPEYNNLVKVYFDKQDWENHSGIYTTDFRPFSDSLQWKIKIRTLFKNINTSVSFNIEGNMPDDYDILLANQNSEIIQNIRENNTFIFNSKNEKYRTYILAVGSKSKLQKMTSVPDNNLRQNFPNPFNTSTTINYYVAERGKVSLKIYNIKGEIVKTLISNPNHPIGQFSVTWNGKDLNGTSVPSGLYLYHLVTEQGCRILKMALIR
ncbi:MAG: choice-of-anchor D domain-containing protein, partial [Candidatus Lokiarchaeota archaeon]|nr:choice-of-anchor D domain-containing protein [Candidatus Lokiarchaeota archaeon]